MQHFIKFNLSTFISILTGINQNKPPNPSDTEMLISSKLFRGLYNTFLDFFSVREISYMICV